MANVELVYWGLKPDLARFVSLHYPKSVAQAVLLVKLWNLLLKGVKNRGGQIIRIFRRPHPRRIADALWRGADEDQCVRGAARMPKGQKCGKRVKNADNAENARTAQEKRASSADL